MLPNLFRPCRQVATLCDRHALRQRFNESPQPLFTFTPERCFLADVFNDLPDQKTDTQQLSLAVVHDDQYHEANNEFRDRIDSNAKPIDSSAFIQLLNTLEQQLTDVMLEQGESLRQPCGRFRASPMEYLKSISEAKKFLAGNMNREFYLIIFQYV